MWTHVAPKIMGAMFLTKKQPWATYPQVRGFQKYCACFSEKKQPWATYPQVRGFQKYGGPFFLKKNSLEQRTHKLGAPRNMGAPSFWKKIALSNVAKVKGFQKHGALFSGKRHPWATYPQVKGFQKYGALFSSLEQRTHKLGASKNMGALFLKKKAALSNVPTS